MTHKLLVDVDVDSTLIIFLHVHGGAHQQVVQVVPIQVSCAQGCTKVRPKLQQKEVKVIQVVPHSNQLDTVLHQSTTQTATEGILLSKLSLISIN